MRPVVWSASSLNAWQSCHLQWYFSYVLLEQGETSEAQAVGIAVHELAERALRGEGIGKGSDPAIEALVDVFLSDILPTYVDPVLVEAPFQIEIDGIPYSGIIDAVDTNGGVPPIVLRDLKTTSQRPSRGKYRMAMTGYWMGAEMMGFPPDAAQLDYIVRTRKPYYWAEAMDPITNDDKAALSAALQTAQQGIETADWSPTGLGTLACSWCPHRASCGPYARYLDITNPLREEAR